MAAQRLSYTGERIDVGIDVHKETYTVTCLCQRQMVKTATVPADPVRLAESLPRWFPGARLFSAYEAGFSGCVLHRVLTTAGITNIVVNPASVAVAANDKVKTDRRDAKKLARDLADGRLRAIYVPTAAEELGASPPPHPRPVGRAPRHHYAPDQSQTPPVWPHHSGQSALDE